jgi:hypothetical protein
MCKTKFSGAPPLDEGAKERVLKVWPDAIAKSLPAIRRKMDDGTWNDGIPFNQSPNGAKMRHGKPPPTWLLLLLNAPSGTTTQTPRSNKKWI